MPTLIAYRDGREVFRSDGHWLHPLFELETFLQTETTMPGAAGVLSTYDKVVGRAGALLSVRLGIVSIRTDVASELGLEILQAHGVRVEAAEVCHRIACATEELLQAVTDPEEAYRIVVRRMEERS